MKPQHAGIEKTMNYAAMIHCSRIFLLLFFLFLLLVAEIDGLESLALTRRTWLQHVTQIAIAGCSSFFPPQCLALDETTPVKQPFQYSNDWTGTLLQRMELKQAVEQATVTEQLVWPMGRWPDPVLRLPAAPVEEGWFGTATLQTACDVLVNTCIHNEAIGLAAQQCAVNARIVALLKPSSSHHKKTKMNEDFEVMINPQIIARSAEKELKVWNEHCLVLPPTFVATVLRDAVVHVQYRTADGRCKVVRWKGEVARALQHELDHDRGILVTDHVGLSELENNVMRSLEQVGHEQRMQLAFDRYVYEPWEALA